MGVSWHRPAPQLCQGLSPPRVGDGCPPATLKCHPVSLG